MVSIFRALAVVLSTVAFTYGVQAASFTPPARGTIYTDVFDAVPGKQVPLPPGEWLLVGYGLSRNNARIPVYTPQFLQVKDNVVVGLVEMKLHAPGNLVGAFNDTYTLDKGCYRNDMILSRMIANGEGREQDCWHINHVVMTLGKNPEQGVFERYNYLKEHGLVLPINMIKVEYHFAKKQPDYLNVSYGFNPEAEGFKPPKNASWQTSDWHKDRYYADPKKVAYIQKLIAWGEEWHERVKQGYLGKLKTESAENGH